MSKAWLHTAVAALIQGWAQPAYEEGTGLETPEVSSHQPCWDAMKNHVPGPWSQLDLSTTSALEMDRETSVRC